MAYRADSTRYDSMPYRRTGSSGLDLPDPLQPPAGCRFHPRCPEATERCRAEAPVLRPAGVQWVACHFA